MIRVQADDFDLGAEMKALTGARQDIGAVVSFTGKVRDFGGTKGDGEETLAAMTLEHYPGMTEKMLADIEAEALKRWDLQESLIIHRYGRLEPGDQIVLVITASAHRQDAFEANAFLMDWLKTKAPFWKLEESNQGRNWVEAKKEDDEAAARWQDQGHED
jgi:molybdopterin synthase catalytic subunit